MRVLVIIPCYNEEANIERVVARLTRVTADLPYVVDYVIVNDCSTDRSAEICQEHNFSYLSLPINLGIGGGVQSGYMYARYHDYAITVQLDGDGQHDHAYLLSLIHI